MLSDETRAEIRARLAEAFADRLRGVVLYGSEARGEAAPDSDIDLLVLLNPPLNRLRDLQVCIHALYPLVLRLERPIDARPVDAEQYEAQEYPLYCEANREGTPV